jgi:hypothetical protein
MNYCGMRYYLYFEYINRGIYGCKPPAVLPAMWNVVGHAKIAKVVDAAIIKQKSQQKVQI